MCLCGRVCLPGAFVSLEEYEQQGHRCQAPESAEDTPNNIWRRQDRDFYFIFSMSETKILSISYILLPYYAVSIQFPSLKTFVEMFLVKTDQLCWYLATRTWGWCCWFCSSKGWDPRCRFAPLAPSWQIFCIIIGPHSNTRLVPRASYHLLGFTHVGCAVAQLQITAGPFTWLWYCLHRGILTRKKQMRACLIGWLSFLWLGFFLQLHSTGHLHNWCNNLSHNLSNTEGQKHRPRRTWRQMSTSNKRQSSNRGFKKKKKIWI